VKKEIFKFKVEKRLGEMGWLRKQFHWEGKSARLLLIVDGEFKAIPLRANMKSLDLEYQLGRIAGFAELLDFPRAGNNSTIRMAA